MADNTHYVKFPTAWQPDPLTIEWVARELQWELDRQDTRGPVSFASSVPTWLRRLAKDQERQVKSRL